MKIVRIKNNDEKIKELARPHFLRMCPCIGSEEERRIQENALLERMENCSGIPMPKIICAVYEHGRIEEEMLYVEGRTFPCHGLFSVKKDIKLEKVFVCGMCIPEAEMIPEPDMYVEKKNDVIHESKGRKNAGSGSSVDLLEEFYRDCYMTALLDGAREWMREYLSANWNISISAPFGPGFFSMGVEHIPTILKLIDGNSIGLEEYHGALYPPKSNICFYLAFPPGEIYASGDCSHCLARGQNCMFCMNNKG